MKKCACCHCKTEAECADNDWSLYDPYNKKCPNHLSGVKAFHKFLKQEKKNDKYWKDLVW